MLKIEKAHSQTIRNSPPATYLIIGDGARLVALDAARVLVAPPEVEERRDVALRGSRLQQLRALDEILGNAARIRRNRRREVRLGQMAQAECALRCHKTLRAGALILGHREFHVLDNAIRALSDVATTHNFF